MTNSEFFDTLKPSTLVQVIADLRETPGPDADAMEWAAIQALVRNAGQIDTRNMLAEAGLIYAE